MHEQRTTKSSLCYVGYFCYFYSLNKGCYLGCSLHIKVNMDERNEVLHACLPLFDWTIYFLLLDIISVYYGRVVMRGYKWRGEQPRTGLTL